MMRNAIDNHSLPQTNDYDCDGKIDDEDNCPTVPNPEQIDSDADSLGDSCDSCPFDALNDGDNDGICACISAGCSVVEQCTGGNTSDCADNCPTICNPNQADADGDYAGDLCDAIPECGGCGQPTCEQPCS